MKALLKVIFVVVSLFVLGLVYRSSSFATDTSNTTATPTTKLRQEFHQDLKQAMKDNKHKDGSGSASSTFKQQACEEHIKVIKLREANIAGHGLIMLTRLNAISEAVQKFYTEKLVPAGKTVSNYDALVSDVSTKKAALSPLIDKVKADSESLTCDKDQARTLFQTFKTDWQSLLTGFKAYRISVINLVKAVRTAAGNSPTVSPTVAPTVEPTAEVTP